MNNNDKEWVDPIVAEVRKNREKLFSESHNDIEEYAEHLKCQEERLAEKGVRYVSPPPKYLRKKDAA